MRHQGLREHLLAAGAGQPSVQPLAQHPQQLSHTTGSPHAIDPAIAGAAYDMSAGDDGNTSEGRSKGRRELSTSKRAAQNRAAQVRTRDALHSVFANSGSALSDNARKSTSSSSRTKSRSLSSCANYTRHSKRKTINCAITSSTSSHDCSRHRARFHLRLLALTSTDPTASRRTRISPSHGIHSMLHSLSHRNSRRVVRVAIMEAFLSARSVSFRWQHRQRRLHSMAQP